jgi:predicted nucleotidyltransferase
VLDIEPQDLALVRAVLAKHVPEIEVRAIGSRVKGTARKFSDLDLVLMTDRRLDLLRFLDLKDAFSDSDLPYLVDIVDWAATSPSFRGIIERENVVIATPRSP